MSTLVEPNQMILAILVYQLKEGKVVSVSRNIVNVFVSKLCLLSAPFLTPAETKILVLLSTSVERFGVSRMRVFLKNKIVSHCEPNSFQKPSKLNFFKKLHTKDLSLKPPDEMVCDIPTKKISWQWTF